MTMIQYHVTWKNDLIIMRLNESVYDYHLLPEATLYENGMINEDIWCYYERGVDRTFLTSVNGKVVRDTIVYYRVTYPNISFSHTQAITFRVIDDIPPTIDPVADFDLPYGTKLPDLKTNVNYYDNYDGKEDLKLEIDSTNVLINQVGSYLVKYRVTDKSGNQTTRTSYVNVYDHLPPVITLKKQIVIEAKKPFHYQEFIQIKDDVDSAVTIELDTSNLDLNKVGIYKIIIYAKDQSNNASSLDLAVEVIDKTKPIITLTKTPNPLSVYENITTDKLKEYVLSVIDDVDDLAKDDLVITHDINTNIVGAYTVYFQIKDKSNNETNVSLKVDVKDLESPSVWWDKPLYFAVNSDKPILELLLDYEDNYDQKTDLTVKITSTFKMDKIGRYLVTAEVTDRAKNKTTIYDYLELYDNIMPNVNLVKEIIITDFSPKQYENYLDISDNYDQSKDLVITYDDKAVDYQTVGIYPIIFHVHDTSNNTSVFESEVYIIDIIAPVLSLNSKVKYLAENEEFNPLDFVLEISDNHDQLTIEDLTITPEIETSVPGYYIISYRLKDKSNNLTEETLELHITRKTTLILTVDSIEIYTNELFDPMKAIIIDSNYTYEHFYTPLSIDTSKPQELYLHHVAINEYGKRAEAIQKVTIIEKTEKYRWNDFILTSGIIITGVFVSIGFILKKKSLKL